MADVAGSIKTTATLDTTIRQEVGTYSGVLETTGDHDWIRVTLEKGATYDFFLGLQSVGDAGGDSELTLRDASGKALVSNDDADANKTLNSFLSFEVKTSGTYYLDVSSHDDLLRGSYSVLATHLGGTNVFLDDMANAYLAQPNDRAVGDAGDDNIDLSAAGFDALGEQGNDTLVGNDQTNILDGGVGNDFASGGKDNDFIFGDSGDDDLLGDEGNDQLFGGSGLDDLSGNDGIDQLKGGDDQDRLFGGDGNDVLIGGAGADSQDGGNDNDTFVIAGKDGLGDRFIGGDGIDTLQVEGKSDVTLAGFSTTNSSIERWSGNGHAVHGTAGAEVFDFSLLQAKSKLAFVDAGPGNDILAGSKFADDLRGGAGNDKLEGGLGKDLLSGGPGKDTFIFRSLDAAGKGASRDTIRDFSHGQRDKIDLTGIDASTHKMGQQAFHFIAAHAFTHHDGELRFSDHVLQGDVNGDGKADFEIHVNAATLAPNDFVAFHPSIASAHPGDFLV
jgi:Ca2+-binding RTX toxin-like protein